MAEVSLPGLELIRGFEGCNLTAYKLPGETYWTVGWGHTGPEVRAYETINQQLADGMFHDDIQRFAKQVEGYLAHSATQGQFDALVSLAYNIGIGNFQDSTLLRVFNTGDMKAAVLQFCEWNKDSTGQISLGLVRRRAAEMYHFLVGPS
jgi:lysozyme